MKLTRAFARARIKEKQNFNHKTHTEPNFSFNK